MWHVCMCLCHVRCVVGVCDMYDVCDMWCVTYVCVCVCVYAIVQVWRSEVSSTKLVLTLHLYVGSRDWIHVLRSLGQSVLPAEPAPKLSFLFYIYWPLEGGAYVCMHVSTEIKGPPVRFGFLLPPCGFREPKSRHRLGDKFFCPLSHIIS